MNLHPEVGTSLSAVYADHMTHTPTTEENTMTTDTVFQSLWDAPLSRRGFLHADYHGNLHFNGLDHAELSIVGRSKVPGLGITLTVHEKGSTHWAGRGNKQVYDGATLVTILVEEERWQDRPSFRYIELGHSVSVSSNATERRATHARLVEPLMK